MNVDLSSVRFIVQGVNCMNKKKQHDIIISDQMIIALAKLLLPEIQVSYYSRLNKNEVKS